MVLQAVRSGHYDWHFFLYAAIGNQRWTKYFSFCQPIVMRQKFAVKTCDLFKDTLDLPGTRY